jgi:hypothetical protein
VFYLKNKITGQQTSLKTRDKLEAQRVLQAHNKTERQPSISLRLARVYPNATDPKLSTRTWQEVMDPSRRQEKGRYAVALEYGYQGPEF